MVNPVRLARIAESSSELALSDTQIKNLKLICFTPIPGLQQPQILYNPPAITTAKSNDDHILRIEQ
ncbi:unnamed protein product [Fusarium venenatum]|uniref:Uncharacterized protein n=1 Tax=Fusarium venenatum TaxID=56646 RepID=A0A2L2TF88_9HYPO|nr:uncharacterized protein FVRRES_11688 [Fusarium venenatum]CEI38997.1 unnamed protein product [Fusarium venenatum]